MKKWLFWAACVCYTSAVQAGPLGLDMGTPFEVLNKQLQLNPDEPYMYTTKSLPNVHPDFEFYMLLITPKHGLCKILASGQIIRTSVYSEEVKRKFKEHESALTAKYGHGKEYDFLRSGSIWSESRDWMMGLKKKERVLASIWNSKERELLDNISTIDLQAKAQTTEEGYIQLSYEFKNFDDCHGWMQAQKDKPL